MQREYQVRVDYDNGAEVWIATSDDIVGLVLEDESPEYLMKRVAEAAPELIKLNNLSDCKAINFSMTRKQRDVASSGRAATRQ